MVVNVISVAVLVGLLVLFIFLASRAWRSRKPLTKWLGGILSSLLTLVFLALTAVVALGYYKASVAPYQYSVQDVKVAGTPDQIARGAKAAVLCADCHSSTGKLPLDGSKDNFVAGGPPLGQIWAPNLTPGGPLKDWTDGEIIRAVREGVDKNGRPLIIMPSVGLHGLSDQDVQAIVAYLRSQPALNRPVPERQLTVLAAAFLGSGMFPTSAQPPINGPVAHPTAGTVEYGKYIVGAYGCRDCHGPNLQGSSGGNGIPAAPALAGVISAWKAEDLAKVFREGVDPTGHQLGDGMPWKGNGGLFTDQELKDLYSYLSSLQSASTK